MFANGPVNRSSIPGRVIPKTQKWYLIPPCLAFSTIRWGSRVKWSNPGKGVAPSPAPRWSSYWKGSLRVTLDYSRQLYFTLLYIYIYKQNLAQNISLSFSSWYIVSFGPGDLGSISGRVIPKTQKWYLMPPCLTLSIIRYVSRVKSSNPGEGVAPSPIPRCSSYRKERLRVTLNFTFFYFYRRRKF